MTPGEIEAAIVDVYARELRFPDNWTDEQRGTFLADHTAAVVSWVLHTYDDIVNEWIDTGRRHHWHDEDITTAIASSRETLLDSALNPTPDELPTPDDTYFD